MTDFHGKRFVASYSGGKDSALAVCRATEMGMVPMGLITTYNEEQDRSWFHGIPAPVLEQIGSAMGMPAALICTSGQQYRENFVKALQRQKALGAEVCVFGDIDIAEHLQWCSDVCRDAGIAPCFPLWQESREALVRESVLRGFTATVTVVDTRRLPPELLGEKLTLPLLEVIRSQGADICGENGEYHTFVSDGPIFQHPVPFMPGCVQRRGAYAVLPVCTVPAE